jgi:hypothetical protein
MAKPSSGHQKASGAVRRNQRYLRLSGGAKCRIPKNETNYNAPGPKGSQTYQNGIDAHHRSGMTGTAAATHAANALVQ